MVELSLVKKDGRRERSSKSRDAILKALVDMVNEGVMEPTAQQVSDRAGVGIRTVFRHFDDMESLFKSMFQMISPQYNALLLETPKEGSIDDRVDALLKIRFTIYEQCNNLMFTTICLKWKYLRLQQNLDSINQSFIKQLEVGLPEVQALSKEKRVLIDGLTSFELWRRMTNRGELTESEKLAVVAAQIKEILIKA